MTFTLDRLLLACIMVASLAACVGAAEDVASSVATATTVGTPTSAAATTNTDTDADTEIEESSALRRYAGSLLPRLLAPTDLGDSWSDPEDQLVLAGDVSDEELGTMWATFSQCGAGAPSEQPLYAAVRAFGSVSANTAQPTVIMVTVAEYKDAVTASAVAPLGGIDAQTLAECSVDTARDDLVETMAESGLAGQVTYREVEGRYFTPPNSSAMGFEIRYGLSIDLDDRRPLETVQVLTQISWQDENARAYVIVIQSGEEVLADPVALYEIVQGRLLRALDAGGRPAGLPSR